MSRMLLSLILLMSMGFCGCGLHWRNTDNIDGGVVTRNSGDDSPKVIESTEIISYDSEFSFISSFFDEESELLIGEIVNVCAEERVLDEKGNIDPKKLNPITYDPVNHAYLTLGEKVGNAFSDGKKIK